MSDPDNSPPPKPDNSAGPDAAVNAPDESTDEADDTGEIEIRDASGGVATSAEEAVLEIVSSAKSGGLGRTIVQGLIGAIVLLVLVVNPGNILGLEEVAAFVLVIIGAVELFGVVRNRERLGRYAPAIIAIAAGVMIWIWPAETRLVVGFIIGGVLILRGLLDIWSAFKRWNEKGSNTWIAVRGLILASFGAFILIIPSAAVPFAVVGGALVLIARAGIAIAFSVTKPDEAPPELMPSDTYSVIAYWLSKRQMSEEAIDHVEDSVFLNRGSTRDRVTRFAVLMGLATAIATFGIGVDSTAVVIGAMLVAPLMTPILGVSAGLINGRTRATLFSAAVVAGGSLGAIALAWLLSALIPNLPEVVENSQVLSRTAPTLLDLAIAVAAGAAGAYGVSRADTSDALPGVAVAIALVPPLAVVGITLHAGDFQQAAGATLLFFTNLFSIVLMAGLVFLVVGYGTWSRLHYRRNRIRTAFAIVVLAVVLISIPLALTAQSIVGTANDLRNASSAVNEWLGEEFENETDPPLRVNDITVDGNTVIVQLVGWEEPPASNRLQKMLTASIGRQMTASVRWIEEQIEISTQLP